MSLLFGGVTCMKKNLLIYLTSFFCGMSVMAVELSASRLLAPYFGTSSIVWTIIIGLIMISLSIGNILGGRSADKSKSMDKLYTWIWIASVWVAVIPLIGKYIVALSAVLMMWILPGNLLVAGSAFSCLIIFSLPLVILGMVSPFLVKLGVTNMEDNGKTTGQIYAVSTIGSIIGTFVPTFFTIPYIGTGKTFFVFALVLNLLCLYYFVKMKDRVRLLRTAVSTIIIAVLLFVPFQNSYAFWKQTVLEDESLYNYLQVAEAGDSVILSTNVAFGVQSIYNKNNELTGYYYDYGLMAPLFLKDHTLDKNQDLLILGLGTGTYAKMCKRYFPNTTTDGVEIDQKIVNLSKQYFDLTDEEANIFVDDGRTFLMREEAKKYDVIMVDAYHDITIPFHMSTREFFSEVKQHLKENGILLININLRSEKYTEITDYLTETVKSCMNKVYKYNIPNGTNTLVFSSDDEDCLEHFKQNMKILEEKHPLHSIAAKVDKGLIEIPAARHILTDDIAPVEIMGQKVLDEVVLDSLTGIKEMLGSSGSIRDVFKMLE
jgi:spermidine synthase